MNKITRFYRISSLLTQWTTFQYRGSIPTMEVIMEDWICQHEIVRNDIFESPNKRNITSGK